MKTVIAIPCMDTVPVAFMQSLLYLDKPDDTHVSVATGSLIYDSRNMLLERALNNGADRILWLDSDMTFQPDVLARLNADIDEGCEIVTGLYTKRVKPFTPVIYKDCYVKDEDGYKLPTATCYTDYPRDSLFEVAACGFGCVLMTGAAAIKIIQKLGGKLFMPVAGFGEDMSFCMRAAHVGVKIWCDSRIKLGHVGYKEFTVNDYEESHVTA